MRKAKLEKMRKKLEGERVSLEESLKIFASKDPVLRGDWDTKFPQFGKDPNTNLEQEADEVGEYINRLPVEHSYELRLQAINSSLNKMKKGSYGICENCRKPIPQKRLEAYPEARFCLKCDK